MGDHNHNYGHSNGHDHGHGSHSHSPPPEPTSDSQSLYKYINHDLVWTMNESERDMGKAIIKPYDERFDTNKILESDADEQLIMYIPFTGLVKIYSILIRTPSDDYAPQTIKIFKNRDDIDFSVAGDLAANQTIIHPSGVSDIVEYPLKRSVFTNVKNITLFVEDNHGGDTTKLTYIGLRGEWKELSKDPVITIYEAAANPRDHKSLVPNENIVTE
ncbi:galactose-binding domain-like protein [Dipodascopsis uninucleata]